MKYLFGSEIPTLAFHFRDYIRHKYQVELELREIENENGTMTALFIAQNEPHFAQIEQEASQFLQQPFDQKYQQSSWEKGELKPNLSLWKNLSRLDFLSNFSQVRKQGNFTLFITALCVLIQLAQWFGYQDEVFLWSHFPIEEMEKSELWRYLSHSLVHLSLWHFLFNLTWWWIFAGIIERHFGTLKLITLFLLSALISGICQNLVSGPYFFGLSGVVYAVLGFALIQDKFQAKSPFQLPQGFLLMLIIGIATGFITPFFGIQMGNSAHISGLLVGILLGVFKLI